MRPKPIALALIGLILAGSAVAETSGILTWQDCVRLAALKNPDLLSALRAMEASRAGYRGSYNGVLPKLALSNSVAKTSSNAQLYDARLTASLDLIDVNQWASIQFASAALRQSQANREVASSTVLLSLYKAFAGVLYSQEQIHVSDHIRALWQDNAQMVNLRYQSGRESKGNNMRTEAESLQADLALAQASRDLRVSQQQLSQALGQDDFAVLAVTGTWTVLAVPSPLPEFGKIVESLPSVRAQQAFVEQARASVRSAQSAIWPTVSLNYNKGVTGATEFPTNPYWTFTGAINLPLFGGGPTATYYASSAAQRTLEKAQSDLVSLRHQARTDLESAWANFAQAQDEVRIQRAFLNAAIQRKGESDIRYQSGLMTFQDWTITMNDYVNSEKGFLSAEQNVILAEAQWRFASGKQLEEQQQ